ncbi:hypothetical protein EhVM1_000210 [Emiliania huxleyi virus M1]|nr:hypothetical protein EhVM1_000210 [Emiliania huxleyi virus M1]
MDRNPTAALENEYDIYKIGAAFGEKYEVPYHSLIRNIFIIGSVVLILVLAGTGNYQSASIVFVSVGLLYVIFSSVSKTHVARLKSTE